MRTEYGFSRRMSATSLGLSNSEARLTATGGATAVARSRHHAYAIVRSAHEFHTCGVSSQSQRQLSTYSPGWMVVGTLSRSTIW